MAFSLESFHFNPVKFGQIVKQYAKERGISQATMAARTGMSFDALGNLYSGKVQKPAFETVFKICVVLAVPVEVIMMLMLKDEDIDFEDKVLLYDTTQDAVIKAVNAVPSFVPDAVPDAVADTATAVTAAMPTGAVVEHVASAVISPDELKAAHAAHVADLKEAFAREREVHTRHCEQIHALAMGVLTARG